MDTTRKIGFIGLGVMGNPMSRNLVQKSGCPVMVYDINEVAMEEVVSCGAEGARNLAQVGEECQVLFTMLPRDEHVQAVYGELFALAPGGRTYVDMSTISPAVSRKLAVCAEERGEAFLDAPVVKSRQAAMEGKLGIYVGGKETVCRQVEPFLQCMGSQVLYLGEHGAGLVMKLCHNMLVGQIQNGVNEMLTLAKKAGNIDPETFAQAAACGGAQNFYLDSKVENLEKRDYRLAFAVEYMHKDVHLAKNLCRLSDLAFPGVELVAGLYDRAMEAGLGKLDFSSTFELF